MDIEKVKMETQETSMDKLRLWLRNTWSDIKGYLNPMADLEGQTDVEASIRAGVSFKGSQLLTLIFAIFIAKIIYAIFFVPIEK